MPFSDPHRQLFERYEQYRESSVTHRRFKPHELAGWINKLKDNPLFEVQTAGKSHQSRDIFLVKAGKGKTKILLWSQMHGDEATATMALLDIFNFLSRPGDLQPLRDQLLAETTLYFVPMLNPDGAEVFERRNAQGIDMNRDAKRLATPEGRLLRELQADLRPDFGFNLHDQNTRYTAGKTRHPATISLLAPPIDPQNSVNDVRRRAVQLVVQLNRHLQGFIPNQVGRWSDEFEPRAFGENMQIWGTSTVLVESGGYANDPEKQFIRKLNFVLLLDAFHQIATKSYAQTPLDEYAEIPQNERHLFDLLIRNVQANGYRVDVGINRPEKTVGSAFYTNSQIEDWGDLSVFFGYEELDGSRLELREGRLYPSPMGSVEALRRMDLRNLVRQGYVAVRVPGLTPAQRAGLQLPVHVLDADDKFDPTPGEGNEAHFLLTEGDKIKYAVANGRLYRVD